MKWAAITVETTPAAREAAAAILYDAGVQGLLLEERDTGTVSLTGYLPAHAVSGSLQAELRARIGGLAVHGLSPDPGTVTVGWVAEEDWAHSWKTHYRPLPVGERLLIVPSWEAPPPDHGRIPLVLDPGMAFGTGSHPTTVQCLELLEELVAPGSTVVDLGTGSGILAVAAARLGAARVVAVDVDPQAVCIARENCRRNGVAARVQVAAGSAAAARQLLEAPAHLVVANIVADVLIPLAAPSRALLGAGGYFLCAGVVGAREADMLAALAAAGFRLEGRSCRGEWVALTGRC